MKALIQPKVRQRGLSLVELVIAIIIIPIAVAGVMLAFSTTLGHSPTPRQLTLATQIAQERMELIVAQRRKDGFTNYTDPCPASALCTLLDPTYSVTTAIADTWAADTLTTRYKVITVTVTGPEGTQLSRLITLVANY